MKDSKTSFKKTYLNSGKEGLSVEAIGDNEREADIKKQILLKLENLNAFQLADILAGERTTPSTRAIIISFSLVAVFAGLTFSVLSLRRLLWNGIDRMAGP